MIMEKLEKQLEEPEDAVVANPEPGVLPTIYNLKRDMLDLRRSVWPLTGGDQQDAENRFPSGQRNHQRSTCGMSTTTPFR